MKKIIITFLSAVFLFQSCKDLGTDPVPEYYERDKDIMKMLKERVDYYKKDVGIVVGIIKNGETKIFSYGKLDKNKSDVPDANTIYEIGSITKTFTCTILADMVLKGEISLDDPAQKFMPDGITVPTYNGKQITLRHLATHTSALSRDPENFNDPQSTLEQFFGSLTSSKLTREPGTLYEYSNLGMTLLGYILAEKSGMDYETLLKKRILEPLGMNDTYVEVPASAMNRYATPCNESLVETSRWDIKIKNLGAAGAIKSTMNDMLKYMSANMGLVHTSLDDAIQFTHKILVKNITGPLWSIGLGWHMLDISGTEYITHGGATYGFSTSCYYDPVKKIGALVFTNSRAFSNTTNNVANFTLYNIVSNEKAATIDPAILNDYAGKYLVEPNSFFGSNFYITFTKEGNCLFAQLTGNPKFEVYPESEDKFFWTVYNSTAAFFRDKNNKVIGFDLWFEGNIYKANKVN